MEPDDASQHAPDPTGRPDDGHGRLHEGHDHDHDHDHGHRHGHENDQGLRAILRYLRWAPQMWRSSINDAVVELVAPVAGERVVDIGAGVGASLRAGTRAGATVVAVEPTPFLRRVLRLRRLARRDRARIEVVDGSAEHVTVDDATIDAVWAVNTMHHWTSLERGAFEIARILRPGGRIVLADEQFDDPSHPEYETFGSGGVEHHGFTLVDADTMGGLLRDAGLHDVVAVRRVIDDRPAVVVTATR